MANSKAAAAPKRSDVERREQGRDEAGSAIGPDDRFERAARARLGPRAIVCGVDEAGRGPLAGPVVAAAAALDPDADLRALGLDGLNDSKALTERRRLALFDALRAAAAVGLVDIGVGAASRREIDALNILRANDLAMRRAATKLRRRPDLALIDGARVPPDFGFAAEAIVKGDARAISIAAASIVAKTVRDRVMGKLARRHPNFGWERNAGYPTAEHRAALDRCGPCAHHRRSFKAVREALRGA